MTNPVADPSLQSAPKQSIWRRLWRACFGLVLCFGLLVVFVYVLLGTQVGSEFILRQISTRTGILISYDKGNLRDGIWLNRLFIPAGDNVDVMVDKSYVKLGWQSLISQTVHLQEAKIGKIHIVNFNPPSDKPFDYMTIATPVALRLDNAYVDKLVISRQGSDDVILHDIVSKKTTWKDATIKVQDGKLGLTVGDSKIVDISNINGGITLEGDYPINALATVVVNGLKKHHIDDFEVHATGTLKRTVGQVTSKYNGSQVTGQIVVQGLDDGTPLSAQLAFDEVSLPYATGQNIILKNGTASITGVVKKMQLRINTDLSAKDAPNGHYHGLATLVPTKGMTVHSLVADTLHGDLTAKGVLDWDNDFFMSATATGNGFDLHTAMPDEYKDYAQYLPKTLAGQVGFDFGLKNADDETYYKISLEQSAGEQIVANITQKNSSKNPNPNPIVINATWQDYRRSNLSLLGDVESKAGQVDLMVFDDKLAITANADIQKLLGLPQGLYQATLDKVGDDLLIQSSTYQGEVGQLSAKGKVMLATNTRPLSYDLTTTIDTLNPNAYLGDKAMPIKLVQGKLQARGSMTDKDNSQSLPFELVTDLNTTLIDGQQIALIGKGGGKVVLANKALQQLHSKFDGRLKTTGFVQGLNDNALAFDVIGNLDRLTINKLTLSGKAMHLSAGGVVGFKDGISWRANVHADHLDTHKFYDKAKVLVSGDLLSVGKFKEGKLAHSTGQFDGTITTHDNSLPQGKINLDAIATGNKYTINRLLYDGVAGRLDLTGYVDVAKGVVTDFDAKMNGFDLGYFVKDRPSNLSGDVAGFVNWQADEQNIDIRTLAITGQINNEPVAMTGTIKTTLALPKDIQGYFAKLKKPKFDLDKLTGGHLYDNLGKISQEISHQASTLQDTLADNDKKLRRLIKSLQVNDVLLLFGDNTLGMTGNEQKLAINLDIKAISQIVPTLRGELSGSLVLMGDDNSLPTIYSDLNLANISMPSFALRQGSVLAKVVNLANDQSSMVVQAVGVVAFGQNLQKLRIDSTGTQANHNVALFVNNGNAQIRTRVQGGFDGVQYQGVVSEGRLQTRYGVMNQQQPFELAFDTKTTNAQLAPHCWQTLSANNPDGSRGAICLKETLMISPVAGKVAMVVDGLDMRVMTPLLPSDLSVQAKVNGKINAHWGKQAPPHIDVVLYSDKGKIGLRQEGLPDTTMSYDRLSVIAKSTQAGLKLRTDIKTDGVGDGYVDVLLDPYSEGKPMKGALVLNNLNLAVFRPFFPAIKSLAGELNIAGGVGGTLSKPLFFGNISLQDGQLALIDVPIRLSDIDLTMPVRGSNASLDGRFTSGDGVATITGVLDWQKELFAKVALQGNQLLISQPPLLSARVNPHFEIIARPKQKFVDIKGVVAIPLATIRPPQATNAVVEVSPNVTVIDRRIRGDVEKLLAQVAPWRIDADIGVDLGDEVVFSGFGAKLPLAGALHLTQKGQGLMNARGVIQVSKRTAVDIIGQNLELNYGQIRFDGDVMNPRLSIEAVREIGSQTVGMRVKGNVSNPMISVFNDAGLSEEQAMNALVTGRLSEFDGIQLSQQGFRSQVTNSLAAAGLSLGLQSTHSFTNDLGRAIGLDSLVLDASGSNDDANINVTGYITPDLYIRYGVGVFNAQSTLSMRYQLTRRVYVEATSGIERIVDMVYRWRF